MRRNRSFRGFEHRIAREHPTATAPPVRVLDGVRVHAPTVAAPAHAHGTKHTTLVLDVEEVGPTIVEQNTFFASSLLFHEGEDFGQSGFSFRFATKFGDDGSVHRGLAQLAVAEGLFGDRLFGIAVIRKKPCGEVVAEVADLDLGFTASVLNELLFGDERAGGCGNDNRRDGLEEIGSRLRCGRLRDLAVAPTRLFAEKPLEWFFPLGTITVGQLEGHILH